MRHVLVVGVVVMGSSSGCGPSLAPPSQGARDVQTAEQATSDVAIAIDESRCREGKGRLQPFVVTWDATAQAELAAHAQESLAVVKMAGCSLELLPACKVPGEYRFRKTSGNQQSLEITSRDELYAKLPLGVAQLNGSVGQDKALRLSYFVRGLYYATAPSLYESQLGAGCEGATHLVLNFAAGAFELDVASGSEKSGGADVVGAGAGARQEESRHAMYRGGNVAACSNDSECDAPVRLRLLPVVDGAPPVDGREVAALAVTKPGLRESEVETRSVEDVRRTVRSAFPGFRACYDDLLGRGPKEKRQLEAHFTIEPEGVVSKLDLVVEGVTDAPFIECFREVLYSARFVPAAKQSTVVYPFEFTPE